MLGRKSVFTFALVFCFWVLEGTCGNAIVFFLFYIELEVCYYLVAQFYEQSPLRDIRQMQTLHD